MNKAIAILTALLARAANLLRWVADKLQPQPEIPELEINIEEIPNPDLRYFIFPAVVEKNECRNWSHRWNNGWNHSAEPKNQTLRKVIHALEWIPAIDCMEIHPRDHVLQISKKPSEAFNPTPWPLELETQILAVIQVATHAKTLKVSRRVVSREELDRKGRAAWSRIFGFAGMLSFSCPLARDSDGK